MNHVCVASKGNPSSCVRGIFGDGRNYAIFCSFRRWSPAPTPDPPSFLRDPETVIYRDLQLTDTMASALQGRPHGR
jgi:hypothetical protein